MYKLYSTVFVLMVVVLIGTTRQSALHQVIRNLTMDSRHLHCSVDMTSYPGFGMVLPEVKSLDRTSLIECGKPDSSNLQVDTQLYKEEQVSWNLTMDSRHLHCSVGMTSYPGFGMVLPEVKSLDRTSLIECGKPDSSNLQVDTQVVGTTFLTGIGEIGKGLFAKVRYPAVVSAVAIVLLFASIVILVLLLTAIAPLLLILTSYALLLKLLTIMVFLPMFLVWIIVSVIVIYIVIHLKLSHII
ncbi:uncharacterized protein LOC126834768 [Adelges cooleyi]|uniref:uncharacterized protein LOC126834768 n=1 Tax=Adelges cooleyi TaxID=133065 RepID=UPI00217FBCD3|nr:uncharacterized protein LOC126834768 [Adelges cooleyi]